MNTPVVLPLVDDHGNHFVIFSILELCRPGAHNKYESFDVWLEADGPKLTELDETLDRFV